MRKSLFFHITHSGFLTRTQVDITLFWTTTTQHSLVGSYAQQFCQFVFFTKTADDLNAAEDECEQSASHARSLSRCLFLTYH